MTKQTKYISVTYDPIGTEQPRSHSVPIPNDGIGTRISELSEVIGGRSVAAELMQVSPATIQRYVSNKNMPPFDVAARLCLAANVRMEWLATGIGDMRSNPWDAAPAAVSQVVRHEQLTMALQLASESLGEKVLAPAKHAELVTLIYDLLEEGLPEAKVLRFARVAAA